MAYYVTIEELVSKKFKVDADSMEEAMNIAKKNIIRENLCLNQENWVQNKCMLKMKAAQK